MAKSDADNKAGTKSGKGGGRKWPRIENRRARFEFAILETVECGMELTGTEVKSLRAGNASLAGAYARVTGGEVYLVGANIAEYPQAVGSLQHDPIRDRKLLLHVRQIVKLQIHMNQKDHALVPLAVYFKGGWAKCDLGVGTGKRTFDKRETIQKREQHRDMQRELRRGGR